MRRASSLPAGSSEREINMDVAVLGRVRSGRHAVSGGLARALVLQLALCALCFYAGRNSWVVSQVPTTRLTLRQSPERGEEALNRQEFHELHGELDDLRAELRVALLQKGRAAVDGEPEAVSARSARTGRARTTRRSGAEVTDTDTCTPYCIWQTARKARPAE